MNKRNPVHKTTEGLSGSLIPGRQLKIFILDDDELYVKLLSSYLSKYADFKIYEFSNYNDCLEYKAAKPDVAIIDYYIATDSNDKTNGIKILEKLREKYPNIIGIILSGKAGLPSENDELRFLLETNLSEMKQRFKNGSHFYFFKNKASCVEIFDILSRLSWKGFGE